MLGLSRTIPVILIGLGSAAFACTSRPPADVSALRVGSGAAYLVSQVAADADLLTSIPNAIPRANAADSLVSVPGTAIARTFRAEAFGGSAGTFEGFAPGFNAQLLSRALFLKRGDVFIPYLAVDSHYAPVALHDEVSNLYFYPALVKRDGAYVPQYMARSYRFGPYGIFYPVKVPGGYVSPLDATAVPAAALDSPTIDLRLPGTTTLSTSGSGNVSSTVTGTTSSTDGTTSSVSNTTGSTGPASGKARPRTKVTAGPDTSSTVTTGPDISTTTTTGPASVTSSSTSSTGGASVVR